MASWTVHYPFKLDFFLCKCYCINIFFNYFEVPFYPVRLITYATESKTIEVLLCYIIQLLSILVCKLMRIYVQSFIKHSNITHSSLIINLCNVAPVCKYVIGQCFSNKIFYAKVLCYMWYLHINIFWSGHIRSSSQPCQNQNYNH